MMDVKDRERADSYRRQELDAGMMGAKGPAVKKCPGCGTTIPMEANFCGQCEAELHSKDNGSWQKI